MRRKPLPVAILADDLTGALDTAAPFASNGLDTWLDLAPDLVDRRLDPGADVIALTTESRHLPDDQASERVEAAIEVLGALQPGILFKKIDSLLRGNIAAEVVAALRTTGRRHAIITPAVPSQNRTVRGGTVYVNGMRLPASVGGEKASDMAESAHLPDVLERAGCLHIHRVSAGGSPTLAVEPGLHAYVVDAESEANLDRLAQFVAQRSSEILPVGASGFGRALAGMLGQNDPRERLQVGQGVLLFVIGSQREASLAQIQALRAAGAEEVEVPVRTEPDIDLLLDRASLQAVTSLIIVRPEAIAVSGVSPQMIAGRLGRVAAAIVRRVDVAGLVMAGGDTAAACVQTLGAECLHVRGELHDGIAFGAILTGAKTIPFFTKSGSFGRRDAWTRLAAMLRTARL